MLSLDGRSLRIPDVLAVADARADATLATGRASAHAEDARGRRSGGAAGVPVYGVNTGFGKLSEVAIPPEQLAALQRNLVRSHAAGVGDPLPEREVRAMMLLRANVLATGFAGARDGVVDALLAMLNAGVWPMVPEQGSVGASGDLAPLAHLALALIGEGRAYRDGTLDDASVQLALAGLRL